MSTASISAKIPADLREQIDEIARLEQRSASNVVRLAIDNGTLKPARTTQSAHSQTGLRQS